MKTGATLKQYEEYPYYILTKQRIAYSMEAIIANLFYG